ncbi:DNA helicase PIF1, ATP-dependent [Tanacetum coccineum]
MSIKSGGTNLVSKAVGMAESLQMKPYLFLDELEVDVTGTIVVMIGRVWDGNMIHSTAKASIEHNFPRLKEGDIYLINDFVVLPNKDEYWIFKHDKIMLEFDGETTVRKVSVNGLGFLRYPFQLIDFDSIEPANNKYLIDKLYLSSTSSTTVYDNDDIPCLYRIKVVVADDTAHTVIVMFNDTVTELLKSELEDFDVDEVSGSVKDLDKCNANGGLDKKKKKRYIAEDSETEYIVNGCESKKLLSRIAKAFSMERNWCNTHNSVNFHLWLHSDRKSTRPYNTPTVSEVATVIINDFRWTSLSTAKISAVEEQWLKWTRNNQDTLRVDLYHNICDAVTRGDTNAIGLGKRIILRRTFTGSPRYMMQNYQDAMAICRAYDNPDLFITFTSNPKWPEIAKMLSYFSGQKAHDRPEVGTLVYVIEFQKRGLPHAHILLWLKEQWKCKTPSEIDDKISAELSSPIDDPDGYKVVTDYMLHRACGKDDRYAACTTDSKCSKHFPRTFLPETYLDEEGYPHYSKG